MYTILIKLIKDLKWSPGKLVLMILAAALTSWGISGMLYSYVMSERDFRVNFKSTNPADIEIVVRGNSDSFYNALISMDEVVRVERREQLGGRIKSVNGEWMPLVIFAVDNIEDMELNVFTIKQQKDIPGPKFLVETNSLFFLDPYKDSIEVEIPGNEKMNWFIGGVSHDPRLAPARMEHTVFLHATSIELIRPYLKKDTRRYLIETTRSEDEGALHDIADKIREVAKEQGCNIAGVNIPTPGKHIHQNIVDGISFLQRSAGIILSVMGLILLSLILMTWLFPQIRDVGVMKALGASSGKIYLGYISVLTFIISLGLAIGVPLGFQTAVAYNKVVAYIQNFEPVNAALPAWAHSIAIGSALCIPLFFVTLSLRKASRTSVNDTLNKTFYSPKNRILGLKINSVFSVRLRYCMNNLFRNPMRTLLMIFLITVGLGLFFTGTNLEHSVAMELKNFSNSARYSVRVRLGKLFQKEDVKFLEDLPFVKSASYMKDETVTYRPPDEAFDVTRFARFISTRHVINDDFILKGKVDTTCTDCIYLCGEGVRQEFEKKELGSIIRLKFPTGEEKEYKYAGVFKDMAAIGAPFFIMNNDETSMFNSVALEIKPGYNYSGILNGVDDALLDKGIDMRGFLSVNMRMAQLQGHLEPTYLILKVTGLVTVFLGVIGLLIVLNLTIRERTREIGIMKSIGSNIRKISQVIGLEFLLVNLIAVNLSILITIPLTSALCDIIGETVIYHNIPYQANYFTTAFAISAILAIQALLITINNRFKLRKNARQLLDHNF